MMPRFSLPIFQVLFSTIFLLSSGCGSKPAPVALPPQSEFSEKAKNIVLMIGDGMALSQVSAAVYWTKQRSAFEKFPVVGFHKSASHDDLTTDSAAGATAFACGCKTKNGVIGRTAKNKPCETIFEFLSRKKNYATGMVVTCSAAHATPASFVAHQELRAFTEQIAEDYMTMPPDFFVGGGEAYFRGRADGKNLWDSLENRGWKIRSSDNPNKIETDGSQPYFQFFAQHEPGTASAGRHYLPKATDRACQFLKNRKKNGFILMVEGSQIDWALHSNDKNWLKAEMLDFNEAVEAALQFAAADRETLVIVTGDHECGGLSLATSGSKKSFTPKFANKLHTSALVPIFAFGPGAERFSGVFDNTDVYRKMLEVLDFQKNK